MKRLIWLLFLLPSVAEAATYWVSCPSSGTGDCLTQANACTFSALWSAVAPAADDIINVVGTDYTTDGHYTGSTCMLVPPGSVNGSADWNHTITIQAVNQPDATHDIAIWIDGQGVRQPIDLRAHTGFTIKGIKASGNATSDGVWLLGNSAAYIKLQYVGCWDAPIGRNTQCYAYENNLVGGSTQPTLGPIIADTRYSFGTSRKKSNIYAVGTAGPGVIEKNFVDIWAGSTNIGPKYANSPCYHAHNTITHDGYLFWTGSAMPSAYQLQSGSTWATETTSTTSHSMTDTGAQNWTMASSSVCSLLTATNVKVQVQRHSAAGTWFRGFATSCSGTALTVTVTEHGGAGGPFTDWDITRYYINSAVNQPYALIGYDACGYNVAPPSPSGYDGTTDANMKTYGIIGIVRNSDTFAPNYGSLMEYMSLINVHDSILGFGTSYSGKTGWLLGPCNLSGQVSCPSTKNLTATNLTCVGCASNSINADWTATNVVRMANNTGFDWTGATGSNKANLCYLYDDNGNITATQRWPWILQKDLTDSMTTAGYTPIDVQAEAATMFGAIPAACDATVNTPTPTSAAPTNTFTPSNTPTPTFTTTPSRTPTPTPTLSSVCTETYTHVYQGQVFKWTESGPCDPKGHIVPHKHNLPIPVPTP